MNYSNMIEDKNLKKGFIVATLISTIVGTFTASMTLHDKIQESRDKKKQKGVDGGQNDEIKQLKEQVASLKGGGSSKDQKAEGGEKSGDGKSSAPGDKNSQANGKKSEANADAKSQVGGAEKSQAEGEKSSQAANDAKSQNARSWSSSNSSRRRRRRRDSLDADQDFARVANQSKNVIEQTFKDNVRRLGPEYAEGDLTTVNALQSQILEQQKTVIGILQTAVNEGRELTEHDKRRLIAAQNAATDGSLNALQGQYERMAAEKNAPAPLKSVAPAKSAAPPNLARTALPLAEAPVNKPWESDPLPPPTDDRRMSPNYARNAAIAGGIAAAAGAGAYAANRDRERQAERGYSDDGPPRHRLGPDDRRRSSLRPWEQPLPPPDDGRSHMRRQEYSPPRWDDRRFSMKPRDRQQSPYDDRRSTTTRTGRQRSPVNDRGSSFRPREREQEFVSRKPSSDQTAARTRPPDDRRSSMKPRDPDPPPARSKSVAPNTGAPTARATTMLPADLPPAAKSGAKTPAPTAKATTIPPAKPPGGAVKETVAKQQGEAIRPSAVESPRSSYHSSQRSKHSVRGSPPPPKSKMKALPAPDAPLFCRYAQDLQNNGLPLHKTFKPGGPHCCPSCNLIIPVDTRDIWVFSTHVSPQKKGDKPKTRDYRMDSRFVVKCHDGQGKFACVLCDRNRDLDCICKNVESLVKHLGSSHTFEEFDKDPDLVKMMNGSVVEMKGGKELVLA